MKVELFIFTEDDSTAVVADFNNDGDMVLADITKLIDHVYISKAETAACE